MFGVFGVRGFTFRFRSFQGSGFHVRGFQRFAVRGFDLGVRGFAFRVLGFRGFAFRVRGFHGTGFTFRFRGFRGSGFRVRGFRCFAVRGFAFGVWDVGV